MGRSCIEVDKRFLFDSGLKISEEGSEYPQVEDLSHIKAVFLSHAHLDHTGALPIFNTIGLRCSIYCNSMTRETAKVLLKDSYHIELLKKHHAAYDRDNINNVVSFMQNVRYNKSYSVDGAEFRFLDAGHIPGSSSVLLDMGKKRVLYTGDINSSDTRLLKGSSFDADDVDVLICESTYGDREHPDRKAQERDLLSSIKKTIDKSGSVLLPSFAVGRAQEVMMILNDRDFGVPIYLDGMAKKVTGLYQKKPEYIRDNSKLCSAISGVSYVKDWKHRREIARQQGIFVTTSGMLDGGPVLDYLGYLYHNPNNSLFLTGYQVEGSNGRLLMDTGKAYIDGNRVRFKGNIKKYDLSAHSGKSELLGFIKRIDPEKIIFLHGDSTAIESMRKSTEGTHEVYTPKVGDSINI
ncbi:MBL fold metallo-hydrolase [Candidatus Woesearchaeota archaeon]|nr:MBL fold metallo-hydrolase [Candidatus Woesearchaeota archaeon]